MKKKLLLTIILLSFSLLVFSEVKIGVINAQKVIQQTSKGKEITARLERLGQKKQKEVEAMREQIKNLEQELNSPALNAQTRDKKNLDLQRKRTRRLRRCPDPGHTGDARRRRPRRPCQRRSSRHSACRLAALATSSAGRRPPPLARSCFWRCRRDRSASRRLRESPRQLASRPPPSPGVGCWWFRSCRGSAVPAR